LGSRSDCADFPATGLVPMGSLEIDESEEGEDGQ
jgi:hypothetical protein